MNGMGDSCIRKVYNIFAENNTGYIIMEYLEGMTLKDYLSENGKYAVIRLCEQNGERGEIELPVEAVILNLIEDEIGVTDKIEYSPYEIITLGVEI